MAFYQLEEPKSIKYNKEALKTLVSISYVCLHIGHWYIEHKLIIHLITLYSSHDILVTFVTLASRIATHLDDSILSCSLIRLKAHQKLVIIGSLMTSHK